MSYVRRFRSMSLICVAVIGTAMCLGGNAQAKGQSEGKRVIKVEMARGETRLIKCNGKCKGVTVEVDVAPDPDPLPPLRLPCPASAPCAKCPGCPAPRPAAVQPPAPVPSMFKVDVGVSAGALGIGGKATPIGKIGLGVEFRLAPWAGLLLGTEFGVVGGMFDTKVGTMWGTKFGVAFWPSSIVRLNIGAGYQGVRNSRWNLRVGGPVAIVGADFILAGGFAIGVSGSVGPGWERLGGKLGAFWSGSAGFGWFFGGPRQ